MKLSFLRPHKSIRAIPNLEIPDFVVLTGVNGAGKTHLLEAIEKGCILVDHITIDEQTKPIRLFNWMNLVPNDSGAIAPFQLNQERYDLWSQLSQSINEYRPPIYNTLQTFNKPELLNIDIHTLVSMSTEELIKLGLNSNQAQQIFQTVQNVTQHAKNRFIQNDRNKRQILLNRLEEKTKIPLIAFEQEDFYDNFPTTHWMSVDMFQQSFGRLFAEYQRNWLLNEVKELGHSKGNKNVTFLSEQEFRKQHGEPPWDFLNNVFEAANLDFRINKPHEYEDRLYEPILTDKLRGNIVKFADLSSGEKILMSFALCLYYAEDRRQLVDYPKILLFDEIDAPLHPSMTQSLLNTIQDVLINHHKIKVIFTTHSPSTVALAPEDSIYIMNKTGENRLQKTTKDNALAILTSGVPTLSIDYENRRQVFVESQYDVEFYEKIYQKLKSYLIAGISLNFISSGVRGNDDANCDQVKKVVTQLYNKGGNKTVYGIIDWDLKNNESDHRVKVLGQGNRYSIENYIFDPLLLAAFLLKDKIIQRSDIGLNENETYTDIAKLDNIRLQKIADFIVDKIRKELPHPNEEKINQCEYIGGQIINLPVWFLNIQGHELEEKLRGKTKQDKAIFPELKRFHQEPQLKVEILKTVADDIPELLSKDFIDLFHKIQNVNFETQ
jgi:AAA15 family ATPase/GTPase